MSEFNVIYKMCNCYPDRSDHFTLGQDYVSNRKSDTSKSAYRMED